MPWAGKRVLVTGAGGFIGSHLAERVVGLGARTRALVHYRSDGGWGWLDHSALRDQMEVVAGEIRDPDDVKKAVQGVEVVFHLAALIAIPYSYEAPLSYVRTNVEGTLNVLQAAREAEVACLVHTSTSEVYGSARVIPMDETHPLQAQSPYAASKIGADKLVESFRCAYELPVVTLRPFNTFGPRQSARAIVPTIITQCLRDGVVRLGNVTPTRDFNYVENTVDGFVKAAESPPAIGHTINLGTGRALSVEALATMVAELLGTRVDIIQEPQRVRPAHSEVERLLAETTRARALLGWTPAVSVEEGLRLTIAWMKEHLDGYRHGVYVL